MTAYLIRSLGPEGGMQDSCWAVEILRSRCLIPMSPWLLSEGLAHWHLCPSCQISRGCPRTVCPDAEPVSMHRWQRVDGRSPGNRRSSVCPAWGSRMLGRGTWKLGLVFAGFGECRQHGGEAGGRRGSVSCAPDLRQVYDIFWHFPGFYFKYFWGLYFAPACSPTAAPCVDEILSARMLQRLG